MSEVVRVTREGALWWITIAREDALNAINFEVMAGLEAAIQAALEEDEARVIALRGAGARAFISGGDLRAFAPLERAADAEQMARRMRAILDALEAAPLWVIGCVNGDAYGGGCETLLACDLRIAREGARLGFTQARFGLPPGWGGLTRLVELVGPARATRLLALQELLDARDARDLGLLDAVHPPEDLEDATRALAARVASHDRALIAALKQGARRAAGASRAASMEAELGPFTERWASETHHALVRAFLDRARERAGA